MARIRVTVGTSKINSDVSREFEVDDEDLEGLSRTERDKVIDEQAKR